MCNLLDVFAVCCLYQECVLSILILYPETLLSDDDDDDDDDNNRLMDFSI